MCETIAMGFMRVALLLKFSMNAMADIRPLSVNIMMVWIAWILPNAITVDGILWLLQSGYGNGWKFIAVMRKIGGVLFL